ncbi:MAG TPA: helicase-related protein, partial [Myxococcota bacterium]|nr:helicase-related protein [Myxococcota bacterium]
NHSRTVCARLRAEGVRAEHVDGTTPSGDRAAIIGRYSRGDTQVLSNVDVCTEGFDVPETSAVILAAPTKSETKYLQAVGRVTRPAPGKDRAVVLDHAGCVKEFGRPTDDRPYVLHETEVGPTAPTRACPACGAEVSLAAKVCPQCWMILQQSSSSDALPQESQQLLVKLGANSVTSIESCALAAECPRCGGMGRSQAIAAVDPYVLRMQCGCGRRWHFQPQTPNDEARGVLRVVVGAAVSFRAVLDALVPLPERYLPVSAPTSARITVAGALAANAHARSTTAADGYFNDHENPSCW